MKVILLRDVAKIGKRFAIVDVPDGYALNKLIPSKDAEPATTNNIKRINQLKERSQTNKTGHIVKSAKERDITISDDYLKITETIKTVGDHQIIIETQEISLTLPITVVAKSK
jgi:ribosomal protein L9